MHCGTTPQRATCDESGTYSRNGWKILSLLATGIDRVADAFPHLRNRHDPALMNQRVGQISTARIELKAKLHLVHRCRCGGSPFVSIRRNILRSVLLLTRRFQAFENSRCYTMKYRHVRQCNRPPRLTAKLGFDFRLLSGQ